MNILKGIALGLAMIAFCLVFGAGVGTVTFYFLEWLTS